MQKYRLRKPKTLNFKILEENMASPFSSSNPLGYTGIDLYTQPPFITAMRAPTTNDIYNAGTQWKDGSVNPPIIYETSGGGIWGNNINSPATTTSFGTVKIATLSELQNGNAPSGAIVPLSNDVATVIAGVVAGAVPPANETQAGIAEIATQVETDAGLDDTKIVSPLKLATYVAGGAGAGSFTDLTATGAVTFTGATGALSMTSGSASSLGVTGAGIDLTLDSASGQLILTGGESAVNAVRIQADDAAGGIDLDAGTGGITIDTTGALSLDSAATSNLTVTGAGADLNLGSVLGSVLVSSTENAALAIRLHANGGASETIQIHSDQGTGVGSIGLLSDVGGLTLRSTGLASNDAINLEAVAGGVDIDAALQINIATSQSAADSIVIQSSAGGIDILASGAAAGEDIDIVATGSSVNISATENDAGAITIGTNGGTSERITITNAQGTNAASIGLTSTAGGITLTAGLATADAINFVTSAAGGGIDIDSGTSGFIVDTTGAISLDSAAASNFTVTGAFDLSLISSLGSVNVTAGEDAADAIVLSAGAGGIDILATGAAGQDIDIVNTGGSVNISATENDAGAIAITTNGGTSERITVTCSQGTNAASIGLISTAGGLTFTGGLGTADAININASNAAGGIDIDAGTGGVIVDTTGAISLDSAAASNFTVTGAFDLTLNSTAGSVNLTAGEAAADSMVLTNNGMDIVITGAAGRDLDITNTGGSINMTATENVTDAIVITASGAASAFQVDAGTGSFRIGTGLVVAVTSVNNAASPYTVLGTDYFISVDTSGGAVTVTLPAATALAGRTFVIRDTGGAAAVNNITIGGGGTNLVGGGAAAATKVLSAAYSGAIVYSNGATWNYAYVA